MSMKIDFLENEYWYGGAVHFGLHMPFDETSEFELDLCNGKDILDQYSPLFVSTKGRCIYSKKPFKVRFCRGVIEIEENEEIILSEGHANLKGAQLHAAGHYFQLNGKIPDEVFFRKSQCNTWIELMYDQNQRQILEYAHSIAEAGVSSGVLMIDEGWAPDYGDYDFCARKFPDPKYMVEELHQLGFRVMLWVTPYISPDSNCYRQLRNTSFLLKDQEGKTAIREWWNGYSCVLDLTNPDAQQWFAEKLKGLQDRYGIDGFKLDAGDACTYRQEDAAYIRQFPSEHTRSFNLFGAQFPFNEFRAVYNCGGEPLVCRLQDKSPSWDSSDGITALIPNMLAQGLLGYFYGCPDMIGGGAYGAFLKNGFQVDEELYIRWLEASVLCPMLQFSVSPKRVLSQKGFELVQQIANIHLQYADMIVELAKHASLTGEPIMRYMEYEFPCQGFEAVTDQFMLGNRYLVAPVTKKGAKERMVHLPKGRWQFVNGVVFEGDRQVCVEVPLEVLPVFTKVSE